MLFPVNDAVLCPPTTEQWLIMYSFKLCKNYLKKKEAVSWYSAYNVVWLAQSPNHPTKWAVLGVMRFTVTHYCNQIIFFNNAALIYCSKFRNCITVTVILLLGLQSIFSFQKTDFSFCSWGGKWWRALQVLSLQYWDADCVHERNNCIKLLRQHQYLGSICTDSMQPQS